MSSSSSSFTPPRIRRRVFGAFRQVIRRVRAAAARTARVRGAAPPLPPANCVNTESAQHRRSVPPGSARRRFPAPPAVIPVSLCSPSRPYNAVPTPAGSIPSTVDRPPLAYIHAYTYVNVCVRARTGGAGKTLSLSSAAARPAATDFRVENFRTAPRRRRRRRLHVARVPLFRAPKEERIPFSSAWGEQNSQISFSNGGGGNGDGSPNSSRTSPHRVVYDKYVYIQWRSNEGGQWAMPPLPLAVGSIK